jgi:hypothetical protein
MPGQYQPLPNLTHRDTLHHIGYRKVRAGALARPSTEIRPFSDNWRVRCREGEAEETTPDCRRPAYDTLPPIRNQWVGA